MKKRRAGQPKPKIKALWQAMDEVVFGVERTLNLRESLPSAAEARARTEVWLKGRQVTRPEEVLIITGRGNQSVGGVGVIRQEVLAMLPMLRRRGIVESWRDHSPGSIVVKLAPLSVLIGAAKRRRDVAQQSSPVDPEVLEGLSAETHGLLRQLALQNLDSLGVDASEGFVRQEMARTFSALAMSIANVADREAGLHAAITSALTEDGEL
jgi:hypothetical protein